MFDSLCRWKAKDLGVRSGSWSICSARLYNFHDIPSMVMYHLLHVFTVSLSFVLGLSSPFMQSFTYSDMMEVIIQIDLFKENISNNKKVNFRFPDKAGISQIKFVYIMPITTKVIS